MTRNNGALRLDAIVAIREAAGFTAQEKAALFVIYSRGEVHYGRVATLADNIGLGTKQARRILKSLKEKGAINLEERSGDTHSITLNIANLHAMVPEDTPPLEDPSPTSPGGDSLTSPGGTPLQVQGDSLVGEPKENLKDNPKENKEGKPTATAGAAAEKEPLSKDVKKDSNKKPAANEVHSSRPSNVPSTGASSNVGTQPPAEFDYRSMAKIGGFESSYLSHLNVYKPKKAYYKAKEYMGK